MRLTRVLLLVLSVMLLSAWPAQAHTSLVSTDPVDGVTLDTAPEQIVLTFTENLREPSEASLVVGGTAQAAEVRVDGPRLVVTPAEAGDGAHEVNYRVVSADGHPVTGTTTFTVGDATDSSEPTSDDASGDAGDSAWTSPLLLGGLVAAVAVGLAVFALLRGRSGADDDRS